MCHSSRIFIRSFLATFCAGAGQVDAWIIFSEIIFSSILAQAVKLEVARILTNAHINRYVD